MQHSAQMVVKPCKTFLEATSPGSKNARALHLPAMIEYNINIEYENNINRRHKQNPSVSEKMRQNMEEEEEINQDSKSVTGTVDLSKG